MSIRLKIILIVLPLVVATLVLTGFSSYFAASNGISRVAREFLAFKSSQLRKHAESQWTLLVENGLTGRPEMVEATREAVASYAASLATSATELTAAFALDGSVLMATGELVLAGGEREAVTSLALAKNTDYLTVNLGGVQRVGKGFWFEPFGWYVLVTEERSAFYAAVNEIWVRTLIILGASIAAAVVLVLVFTGWLTRPLSRVVASMRQIITTNDLGERVEVEYRDEIGQLAQTFNLMVEGLETAHGQIRRHARSAGVSRLREERLKSTFQKYVPGDVIEQAVRDPTGILQGENRNLSILFTHIGGFAGISESMGDPAELVSQLNRYFALMVDAVTARGGIVDKYIDDTVMAVFGAPVKHEDDEMRSVLTGFDLLEAAERFNREQKNAGRPEFPTSVGISYGVVTVGNIGCGKRMDYTVIGDRVNLASRAQGMCKVYRQPLIFTGSVHRKVKDQLAWRMIDNVAVKGKRDAERIYTAKAEPAGSEKQAWSMHNAAMEEYFPNRNFSNARRLFEQVQKLLPGDHASGMMIERCGRYEREPPAPGWGGYEVMQRK
jgi:adenylate cyclase